MVEYQLHVFELAYLLSLMRVETVAALPNAVLFPRDPQVRRKALQEGERRLIQSGHVVPAAETGTATYDETLLSLAAAIADPQLTILVRRQGADGARAEATIYLTNVEAVEVTQTDRHGFRLRRLADAFHAFEQVRKMIGVAPLDPHGPCSFEVPISVFEQVRAAVTGNNAADALQVLELDQVESDAAQRFVGALATPERKGVVSVLKHAGQKVADVRVLGFYQREGTTWLTSAVSQSLHRVRIEAVDSEGFVQRLVDRVASLGRAPAMSTQA